MSKFIETDIQSIKAGKCHDVKLRQDAIDDHNVAKMKFDRAAKRSMDSAASRTKFIGKRSCKIFNFIQIFRKRSDTKDSKSENA